MNWTDKLAELKAERQQLLADAEIDDTGLDPDEDALIQLVYSAISDFIEHDTFRVMEDIQDPEWDHDSAILEWMGVK